MTAGKAADDSQRLLLFRFLVLLSRQLGFHFATAQKMAGEPMNQHFLTFGASMFGGVFNLDNVSRDSDLVQIVLSQDAWYQPFEDTLQNKFPYLVMRVKGINDVAKK